MKLSVAKIIEQLMQKDTFVHWLGIKIIDVDKGSARLEMRVTKDMVNGLEIAHGGITYSLADTALAFASNAYGQKCVSIETSISHLLPVFINDVLIAKTKEVSYNDTIGIYEINISNQHDLEVAKFKGTIFVKPDKWITKE